MGFVYTYFEEILSVLLLAALCVVVTMQVLSRYVMNSQFSWTGEVSRYLLVWMTFIGTSLAHKNREHFSVRLLPDQFRYPASLVFDYLIEGSVIGFSLILIVMGIDRSFLNASVTSPSLELPMYLPFMILPITGALLLVRSIENLIEAHRKEDEE